MSVEKHKQPKTGLMRGVMMIEITDGSQLKVGDLIYYHDWTSGGFLFGVVVEREDEYYHSKLNIWKSPNSIHWLQAVDAITLIENIEDAKNYELRTLRGRSKPKTNFTGGYYIA